MSIPDTLVLEQNERELLNIIYRTRLRFMLSVLVGLYALGILAVSQLAMSIPNYHYYLRKDIGSMPWHEVSDELAGIAVFFMFLSSVWAFLFFKRVLPFWYDYKNNYKKTITFRIKEKMMFPLTSQYFLKFSDLKYLSHEVDELTYFMYKEGDIIQLFQAPLSKHIFKKDDRFSLL